MVGVRVGARQATRAWRLRLGPTDLAQCSSMEPCFLECPTRWLPHRELLHCCIHLPHLATLISSLLHQEFLHRCVRLPHLATLASSLRHQEFLHRCVHLQHLATLASSLRNSLATKLSPKLKQRPDNLPALQAGASCGICTVNGAQTTAGIMTTHATKHGPATSMRLFSGICAQECLSSEASTP